MHCCLKTRYAMSRQICDTMSTNRKLPWDARRARCRHPARRAAGCAVHQSTFGGGENLYLFRTVDIDFGIPRDFEFNGACRDHSIAELTTLAPQILEMRWIPGVIPSGQIHLNNVSAWGDYVLKVFGILVKSENRRLNLCVEAPFGGDDYEV